jgi:hypothetical protein
VSGARSSGKLKVVSKAVARIGPLALSNGRVRAAITRMKSNVQTLGPPTIPTFQA